MKTCLLSGNFALDTIVTRAYPEGFVPGKRNKFTETIATESVGNTCGNVACILPYLKVQSYPIVHFDLSEQGLKLTADLAFYGADTRFVTNSAQGGTTLLRCTHKLDKDTGKKTISFRASSPGSRFPKRRYIRARDEAPQFVDALTFVPDVFFFDVSQAGLRYIAQRLRDRGTLIYFEPENEKDIEKGIKVSHIIKFSHEKITDLSFTERYPNKLFICTRGADGLDFKLGSSAWQHIAPTPVSEVVDWEGAGDWTTSQLIACLCEHNIDSIDKMSAENLTEWLTAAGATAARSIAYMGSKGMIDAERGF